MKANSPLQKQPESKFGCLANKKSNIELALTFHEFDKTDPQINMTVSFYKVKPIDGCQHSQFVIYMSAASNSCNRASNTL